MDSFPPVFDVLLVGTSLPLSIVAAALSASGKSVLHVDPASTYGSHHASFTILDLLRLEENPPPYLSSVSLQIHADELKKRSRKYALALEPMLIPSFSPLIGQLIGSQLSKQCSFQLLQSLFLYSVSPTLPSTVDDSAAGSAQILKVPASKEDVFKSPLSLLAKRKLMRFLLWAAAPEGEDLARRPELLGKEDQPLVQFVKETFELDEETATALTYAVAHCSLPSDPALPGLELIRRHLLSTGRYGPSAYLLGHYGGAGELAQLFCRMAAVHGTPYILTHPIESFVLPTPSSPVATIKLDGIDETFKAQKVIMEPIYVPNDFVSTNGSALPTSSARCMAVIQSAIEIEVEGEQAELDTALLVFPPGILGNRGVDRAVTALWTSEGSKSCPAGRYVVYLSVPSNGSHNAEDLLKPYLDAFIRLTTDSAQQPLMTMYYTFSPPPSFMVLPEDVYVVGGTGDSLVDGAERAAKEAEDAFWKIVGRADVEDGMWASVQNREEEQGDDNEGEGEEW